MNLALVRSYIRWEISRDPFITFSETLQLVRTQKVEKMFQALFWKIQSCPFWPKTFQIWPFWPDMNINEGFCIFLKIHSLEFSNFFVLSLVTWSRKNDRSADFSKKICENFYYFFILLLFFNRKKIILAEKSTFRPYYQPYESPVSTLFMKLLKRFCHTLIVPILTKNGQIRSFCP